MQINYKSKFWKESKELVGEVPMILWQIYSQISQGFPNLPLFCISGKYFLINMVISKVHYRISVACHSVTKWYFQGRRGGVEGKEEEEGEVGEEGAGAGGEGGRGRGRRGREVE